MEKENKKATASEKLTKVVAIRISQTDYDIFLEKAKMENPESTKIIFQNTYAAFYTIPQFQIFIF